MVQPVSRTVQFVTFALSLLGVGLATYLTIEHFGHSNLLVCPRNSFLNCEQVTTSAQSYFLGIPVAVLGLASYVFLAVLNTPWAWRSANYWLHLVRFVFTMGAMVFVLWLISAELVIIGHLCLYCTGVHLITFALFVIMTRVAPAQFGWFRSAA